MVKFVTNIRDNARIVNKDGNITRDEFRLIEWL